MAWFAILALVALAVLVWLATRRPSKSSQATEPLVRSPPRPGTQRALGGPPAATRSPIPQLAELQPALAEVGGDPGTATERQLAAVGKLEMGPPPEGLSLEQASALLSARSYAEGVIYRLIGQLNHYEGERWVEGQLVAFIVKDPTLRKRVIAWNNRSFARGGGGIPSPKRDEHFIKVEGEAERLLRQVGHRV